MKIILISSLASAMVLFLSGCSTTIETDRSHIDEQRAFPNYYSVDNRYKYTASMETLDTRAHKLPQRRYRW